MFRFLSKRPLTFWLTASLLGLGTFDAAAQRGVPAQEGIVNFGKISDMIYRGAQPDAAGVTNLHRLGIKTIIDLRLPNEGLQGEPAVAQANGILYTNFPLRGFGRPTDEQVQQVLGLIQSLPGPVFIHCKHGCDRTGTIIACYRIQHDQWSDAEALKEAVRYGISWFERGMRSYVRNFAKAVTLAKAVTSDLAKSPAPSSAGLAQ